MSRDSGSPLFPHKHLARSWKVVQRDLIGVTKAVNPRISVCLAFTTVMHISYFCQAATYEIIYYNISCPLGLCMSTSVFHVPVSDDQPPTLPTLILCALVGRCFRPGLPVYLGLCDIQVVPNQLKYLAAASVSCSCKTVCTRSTSPSASHATVPLPVVAATRESHACQRLIDPQPVGFSACGLRDFFFFSSGESWLTHSSPASARALPCIGVLCTSVEFSDSQTKQMGACVIGGEKNGFLQNWLLFLNACQQ